MRITILLTPAELASVRRISIHDVFALIQSNSLLYVATEEGLQIPVTYIWGNGN